MIGLQFTILNAHPERQAAAPTLAFGLRIGSSEPVHAILLRYQIQIEPQRRPHAAPEKERLTDLFGEAARWKDTLQPLIWTRASLAVPGFEERLDLDLPVSCTYDFEVSAAKYLDALEGGEVPLLFLFSGTVFAKCASGFRVEPVPWDKEARFRMPVALWRDLMDAYFPGCAWIRIRRESLDALQRFRAGRGLASWDEAIAALVGRAESVAR